MRHFRAKKRRDWWRTLGYRRLEYTTNCKYALSGFGCHKKMVRTFRGLQWFKLTDFWTCVFLERNENLLGGISFIFTLEEGWLLEDPGDFGREQFPLDKTARLAARFPKSTLAMAGMGTSPGAGGRSMVRLVFRILHWTCHEWQLVSWQWASGHSTKNFPCYKLAAGDFL